MPKIALFYKKTTANKIRCSLCSHKCLIPENKTGICGVRQNKGGRLYSLVYGKPISINIDPIEKKPLYHFMPRTTTLSFGTLGCNFRCSWCQNWEISQYTKANPKEISEILEEIKTIKPKEMIREAINSKCPSISYTYTEPTIFIEYALKTMKLAKEAGLKNIWVSNGYFGKAALRSIAPLLDAINIDVKGFNDKTYQKYCGAKIKPVLKNLKRIKKIPTIHLEITTLIIPGINDNKDELKKIALFIAKKLSKDTPLHFSRFFPCYQLTNIPPTPPKKLQEAVEIGKSAGLRYVYMGNI